MYNLEICSKQPRIDLNFLSLRCDERVKNFTNLAHYISRHSALGFSKFLFDQIFILEMTSGALALPDTRTKTETNTYAKKLTQNPMRICVVLCEYKHLHTILHDPFLSVSGSVNTPLGRVKNNMEKIFLVRNPGESLDLLIL